MWKLQCLDTTFSNLRQPEQFAKKWAKALLGKYRRLCETCRDCSLALIDWCRRLSHKIIKKDLFLCSQLFFFIYNRHFVLGMDLFIVLLVREPTSLCLCHHKCSLFTGMPYSCSKLTLYSSCYSNQMVQPLSSSPGPWVWTLIFYMRLIDKIMLIN